MSTFRPSASTAPDRGSLTPEARHGRLPQRGAAGLVLRIVASALAVLLVSGAGVAAVATYSITSAIRPGVALAGEDEDAPAVGTIEGAVNLLLVGSDSGGGNAAYGERGEELNDVTMLLHISADHEQATVVSFPRDLFVDLPSCPDLAGGDFAAVDDVKMNTALSRGGLACPVLAVEQLSGLDIPFAAVIEFDGVVAMSNAVGGVPVCVATAIHDRQIAFDLEAGEHTLSGADALQFLRTRYGVGDGSDLTRISNQQQFLSSLVRTLKSSDTLSNPVRLYSIAAAAVQNMQFSNSLRSVDTMVSIAAALKDIPLEEVAFVRYPGVADDGGVVRDTDAADVLFSAIAADQPLEITGSTGGGTIGEPDPSAAPSATPSETPGATPEPGASATPTGTPRVELPSSIEGTTADQQTCTAGQTAGG